MTFVQLLRTHHIDYIESSHPWIRVECPECRKSGGKFEDKTLSIVTQRKVWGHCFRCGWRGNEKLLLKLLSISALREEDFPTIEIPKYKSFIQHIPSESVPAWDSLKSREYLQSRNITESQVEKYALYFCNTGFYQDRIILPIFDKNMEYRTFTSRHIGAELPKYRYPKDCSITKLLYNLCFFTNETSVILTEGPFDSIHVPNSVAMFGKRLSTHQVNLLRASGFQEVIMLLDSEARENTPEICEANMQKLSRFFIAHEIKLSHDTPTEYSVEDMKQMCEKVRHL